MISMRLHEEEKKTKSFFFCWSMESYNFKHFKHFFFCHLNHQHMNFLRPLMLDYRTSNHITMFVTDAHLFHAQNLNDFQCIDSIDVVKLDWMQGPCCHTNRIWFCFSFFHFLKKIEFHVSQSHIRTIQKRFNNNKKKNYFAQCDEQTNNNKKKATQVCVFVTNVSWLQFAFECRMFYKLFFFLLCVTFLTYTEVN